MFLSVCVDPFTRSVERHHVGSGCHFLTAILIYCLININSDALRA